MNNKRGQALIEFILIIPVLVLFILGMFDIGNIIYKKYQLENNLDYIVDLYRVSKNIELQKYINSENITMDTTEDTEYTTITISKKITIITPGLSKILGSPYSITTDRVIINES